MYLIGHLCAKSCKINKAQLKYFFILISHIFQEEEDEPIIADKVSEDDTLRSLKDALSYCFANNRHGDGNNNI